jgi:DNA-binding beta-propeller fold protein YncE
VQGIAFAPRGRIAWVSGLGGVTQVNVRTGKPMTFVPAPYLFPRTQSLNISDIAVADGGRVVLVVNSTFPDNPGQGAVAVPGAKNLHLRRDVPVGTEPESLAVDVRRNTTYVPNYVDDTVSYFPTPGS